MYIKRNYGFWMTFNWSKWPFIFGLIYSLVVFGICWFFQLEVSLPWQPIGVVGIAVAFYLGFKNNSSYDRTWEARKIWGSMVNNSRSFGASVCAYVQGTEARSTPSEACRSRPRPSSLRRRAVESRCAPNASTPERPL